jgi:thiol-disulfide isomerase/thioredoxin
MGKLILNIFLFVGFFFNKGDYSSVIILDNIKFQNIYSLIKLKELEGYVLYIDIWSTYCGPCINEFKQSKDLKQRYIDKPVKFVYLADLRNDSSDIKRWKSLINKYELKGFHLQMSSKFYNSLYFIKGIQFTGKPHYLLIDKNGLIVNPNAERPSSKERLYKQIDKLL